MGTKIPYDTGNGLLLPSRLTGDQLLHIADMAGRRDDPTTPWHLGDLLEYARVHQSRREYRELLQKLIRLRACDRQTLYNYRSVAAAFPHKSRRLRLTMRHHDAVRTVPAAKRRKLLDRAEREHLSAGELYDLVRLAKLEGDSSEIHVLALSLESAQVQIRRWIRKPGSIQEAQLLKEALERALRLLNAHLSHPDCPRSQRPPCRPTP